MGWTERATAMKDHFDLKLTQVQVWKVRYDNMPWPGNPPAADELHVHVTMQSSIPEIPTRGSRARKQDWGGLIVDVYGPGDEGSSVVTKALDAIATEFEFLKLPASDGTTIRFRTARRTRLGPAKRRGSTYWREQVLIPFYANEFVNS